MLLLLVLVLLLLVVVLVLLLLLLTVERTNSECKSLTAVHHPQRMHHRLGLRAARRNCTFLRAGRRLHHGSAAMLRLWTVLHLRREGLQGITRLPF